MQDLTRLFAFAAFVLAPLLGAAQAPHPRMPIPVNIFQDPATGVRFQYPIIWKRELSPQTYLAPSLLKPNEAAKVVVSFETKGNLYEKTSLSGLTFSYISPTEATQQECRNRVRQDPSVTATDEKTIHGIPYLHGSGGDAGMCHQQRFETFATYRNGRCYLFEEDFDTSCAFPENGIRALSASERKALQAHLDAIMESVTITSTSH